jgi:phytoene desaturase
MNKKAIVVGAGISGLAASCYLAKGGLKTTVIEKNSQVGGRASLHVEKGFKFDLGPSWYWMPDIFDRFFADFGKFRSDYYDLVRLDPSYRIFHRRAGNLEQLDIPAGKEKVVKLFESIESGAGAKLEALLASAEVKYKAGMYDYACRAALTPWEFIDANFVKKIIQLDLLGSFAKKVKLKFKDHLLQMIVEFPILFLGATAEDTPAMYSLMNYADIALGTWYPVGGIYKISQSLKLLAEELGVSFQFSEAVTAVELSSPNAVKSVKTAQGSYNCDFLVNSSDYHHFETDILSKPQRSYSKSYWEKRVLAPSCLLYYVGIKGRLKSVLHHNLFFDESFKIHSQEIYKSKTWPKAPLFYLCCPSVTDPEVAPDSCENLFILIPVAAGLEDSEAIRKRYFEYVVNKIAEFTGDNIRERIVFYKEFGFKDFVNNYNSFKGNAYGLANTLRQTAFLKPKMKSKRVENLFYCGQLTVPGPGVPPSLLSGEIVSRLVLSQLCSGC